MKLLEHESLKVDTKILLLGQVGSKSYGTSTPESDDDFMGVACAPRSCYTGLETWKSNGTFELKRATGEENDSVIYEIRKFFQLCLGFNPNVIPLLYLKPSDYKVLIPGGYKILENRDMFISHRAFDTFVGYAKSQLLNVKKGVTGKYGEKRKTLIEKHGYDTKFGYHTIRLLGMINEFFNTKIMNVHRGDDIPFLMDIRNGLISEQLFFKTAEHLMIDVETSFKNATWIPEKPDFKRANKICMEIVEENKF